MEITFAQLLAGFRSALTAQGLADRLGVDVSVVRTRLRSLTPQEEQMINEALKKEA